MNLIKFNPFLPVSTQFGGTMDSFFNRGLTDFVGSDFVNEIPSANVIDREEMFEVQIAAPGYSKENFTVAVENQRLIVKAEQEKETSIEDGKYTRREFKSESFERIFPLEDSINDDKIDASYRDGILSIRLPKRENSEIKKLIEVS